MIARLDLQQINDELASLPGWQFEPTRYALIREYRFADFATAFAFMTRIALYAERHDHHPEWFNVYNRLKMTLTTHDVAGVSVRDIELARHAESLFSKASEAP